MQFSKRLGSRLVLGCSAFALCGAQAWADCTPEPTLGGQTTSCTGPDENGLTISTDNTNVTVAPGATVLARLDNAGAIVLQAPSGTVIASLDNSGVISSTGGPAISTVGNPGFQAFQSVINGAGATISGSNGGINVVVNRLENAGVIDGGSGSAYSFPGTGGTVLFPGAIFNSGTIVSNSSAATIDFPFGSPQQFLNSGTIRNAGTGLAVDTGNETLAIVNDATGVISSNGSIALRSAFQVNIINSGTINGSIIGGSGFDDRIYTPDGTINGDVFLNGGNDRLIARIGDSRLVDSVTGTVDGGAGNDLLELIVDRDHSLSNPALPTGFEAVQLDLQKDATLTLSGSGVPTGGYSIRGTGTVKTASDISGSGPLIVTQVAQQNLGAEALNFVNDHILSATLTLPFQSAVSLVSLKSVTNSGTIRASDGNGASFRLLSDGSMQNGGLIEGSNNGLIVTGGHLDNGGTIRSTGGTGLQIDLGGGVVRGSTSHNAGLIEGKTLGAMVSSIVLVNTGTIRATDGVGVNAGIHSTIDNRAGGRIVGTTAGISGGSSAIVLNAGTIEGGVDFGPNFSSPDIFIDRGGSVVGDIQLGDGDDIYIADISRGVTGASGVVDAGSGTDTLRLRVTIDTTSTLAAVPSFERVGYELDNGAVLTLSSPTTTTKPLAFDGKGRAELFLDASSTGETVIDLLAASTDRLLDPSVKASDNLRIVNHGAINFNALTPSGAFAAVTANRDSSDPRTLVFENRGTITVTNAAGIPFLKPFGVFGGSEVVNTGTINLFSAYGVYEAQSLTNSGVIVEAASGGGSSIGVLGVRSVTNSGTIQVNGAGIWLAPTFGTTAQLIDNNGLIESRSDIAVRGSAYNAKASITNRSGANIRGSGVAISVEGSTQLVNDGAIIGDVVLSTNFGTGASTLSNSGTITGIVSFGGGADVLTNGGSISGNSDLGDGDDTLVILNGASFGGTVTGGAGQDTIRPGSGAANWVVALDMSRFTSFETLEMRDGNTILASSFSFPQIGVLNGSVFAEGGTIITGHVAVGNAGIFGSAGTVNGNVTVNTGGTLAPGASPGIMTINGNLAIGNGSTTTFEFVPLGQSDQIIVSGGNVTIGTSTTLNLTGSLLPGSSRDLIIVNGGGTITGTFATVNRDPGIVGVLRYNSTMLQLLGTFVAPANISAQANTAVTYVNGLLTAGTASAQLISAVPQLMSGATANAAAFNLITGETYASASQLGVQQGMALAKAGRAGLAITRQSEMGMFSFAQGFGDWRTLQGNGAIGTSTAGSHAFGVLGGLGFGNENASVGAFIGYIDGRQTITALGARTRADGIVAGLSSHFASNGFSFAGTVAHDWSDASTRRSVPGGATAVSGKYRLRSWVIDAVAGYDLSFKGRWVVRPEVGFIHIATSRGEAVEAGSGAFALAVDSDRTKATFIDGGFRFKSDGKGALRPWAQIGLRHQLSGNVSDASARFAGNAARYTVIGAGREDTVATAGVGADYEVSPGVSLYGAYQSEFGNGRSHNVNLGLRFGF
jgi:uncharacterized protein YhjY with autotransporter beta-barrel domain